MESSSAPTPGADGASSGAGKWVLPSLLGFVFVLRVATLQPLFNPDALIKWNFARRWVLDGYLPQAGNFSHHNARWAINLPVALAHWILGESTLVYYVPVLAASVLQAFLTFRLGLLLAGPATAVAATLAYSAIPMMGYLGSQLMPECFESLFVLGALYAIARGSSATAASTERRRWLIVVWANLTLAWFTRETILFFLPGLLLALWLGLRRLLPVVWLALGFAAVIGLETLVYRWTYGFTAGRFSIVAQHHLTAKKISEAVESVWELFERYAELNRVFGTLLGTALVVTLGWLWRQRGQVRRSLRQPPGQLQIVTWSFFAINTFGLRSLNPPRLIQPPNERYLMSAAPLVALIVFCVGLPLLERWWSRVATRARVASFGLACCVASYLGNAAAAVRHWGPAEVVAYEKLLRQALDERMPVYARKRYERALRDSRAYLRPDQMRRVSVHPLPLGRQQGFVMLDRSAEPWKSALRDGEIPARVLRRHLSGATALHVLGGKHLMLAEKALPEVGPKARSAKRRGDAKQRGTPGTGDVSGEVPTLSE